MANKGICRVGDQCTGTCTAAAPGHPRSFIGTWTTGSPTTFVEGLPVVRIGDTGITDCGHHMVAAGNTNTFTADGIKVIRVGDAVSIVEGGSGVTSTGSLIGTSLG